MGAHEEGGRPDGGGIAEYVERADAQAQQAQGRDRPAAADGAPQAFGRFIARDVSGLVAARAGEPKQQRQGKAGDGEREKGPAPAPHRGHGCAAGQPEDKADIGGRGKDAHGARPAAFVIEAGEERLGRRQAARFADADHQASDAHL